MTMMQAVVLTTPGPPENLTLQSVPIPTTKPGWSLVKIKAFGINHSEIFTRQGLSPSVRFPRILGIEGVGEIVQTTEPQRLPVGQAVVAMMGEMGRAFDGSYAEYALLPNQILHPVVTDLPWATLAAIPETYTTAYGSFRNLKLVATDRVLVRGATSGVGVAFAKLAKAVFPTLTLVGTTRQATITDKLQQVGYDEVIVDRAGQLPPGQYDKVLELIGPKTMRDTFLHVVPGGIVCSTGQLGGQWDLAGFDPIMDLAPNAYLTSFYSNHVTTALLNELLALITKYQIDVQPVQCFPLAQVAQAHQYLESGHSFGKVVGINQED